MQKQQQAVAEKGSTEIHRSFYEICQSNDEKETLKRGFHKVRSKVINFHIIRFTIIENRK